MTFFNKFRTTVQNPSICAMGNTRGFPTNTRIIQGHPLSEPLLDIVLKILADETIKKQLETRK